MVGSRIPTGYNTVSDNARIRDNGIYIGFIKANNDAQKMGRLSVWIPEMCSGNPDNSSNWLIVSYASCFAGATNPQLISPTSQTMTGSQQSYGFWMIPPDVGNQVLVCFVNGDASKGYWFACLYQQNMNHMIPGIACNKSTVMEPGQTYLPPVVEYNKMNQSDPYNPLRPPYTPLADGLVTQGLENDPQRGPASTSARREAPSQVFGFLTPDGNTIHVDDNPENEFIRIRTKSGTQVLVDETTGMVYINSKLGNAWMEISDFGIDIYSSNSVSIRAEKDFNVRADRNIIFDAGGDIMMKAGSDINLQTGGNIVMGSAGELILSSSSNTSLTVQGALLVYSQGNLAMQAGGNISENAAGNCIRQGTQILDNSGGAQTVSPNMASVPQPTTQPDVENTKSTTISAITSRTPSHEPWSGHPQLGTPVEPGEVPIDSVPQGVVRSSDLISASLAPTTFATGTGTANIVSNVQAGCAPPGATSGRYAVKCPPSVYNAIQAASSKTGVDFGTLMAISNVESGFQPNAHNKSTASGLYQFVDTTWSQMVTDYGSEYGLSSGGVFDPVQNSLAGALYVIENKRVLAGYGETSPSTGDCYLAHMLGGGGWHDVVSTMQATPNAPIATLVNYSAVMANKGWFDGTKTITGTNLGPNPTVSDYYNCVTGFMNRLAAQYDAGAGEPDFCTQTGSTATSGSSSTSSTATATGNPLVMHQ